MSNSKNATEMSENQEIRRVTCIAPVNIAVIKYWGKRDEKLILPINDSISVTLDETHMRARTTVMASSSFTKDRLWLNGIEEDVEGNERLSRCLKEIRALSKGELLSSSCKVHVASVNNFPTAAGLASSAAGYACLVYALCTLFEVPEEHCSVLARLGSGSACRSVLGGFVQWHMGSNREGTDSKASQIASSHHWPELRTIILVVNDQAKKVPSSKGMRLSVENSQLLIHRAKEIVPQHCEQMRKAIVDKDFDKFAKLTMRDSNQLHAVCQDTFPPIHYMNDTSKAIVNLVHAINDHLGRTVVAYTFDAGPNACLFLLEPDLPTVLSVVTTLFPPRDHHNGFIRGEKTCINLEALSHVKDLVSALSLPKLEDALKYIIVTKTGEGPKVLKEDDMHLLDSSGELKATLID